MNRTKPIWRAYVRTVWQYLCGRNSSRVSDMINWLIVFGILAAAFVYKCVVDIIEVHRLGKMTPQEKLVEIEKKNFFEN